MQLSKNLELSEVTASTTAKRLCIENKPDAFQLDCLHVIAQKIFQPLRDAFGCPIYVSSGFRSIRLNRVIGGASTSQHTKGQALDLDADRYGRASNKMIFDYIKDNLSFDQLIWEGGDVEQPAWVHVSYLNDLENRCEVLVMYKTIDGKTHYKPWS